MSELSIKRKKSFYYKRLFWQPITLYLMIHSFINILDFNIFIVALLGFFIIIFVCVFINDLTQVLKRSPALVLKEKGIIDHVNFSNSKLISWNNMINCKIEKYMGVPHLVIGLKDFSILIKTQSNLKQKMLEQKIKKMGTPIVINPRTLDFSLDELETIIEDKIRDSSMDN